MGKVNPKITILYSDHWNKLDLITLVLCTIDLKLMIIHDMFNIVQEVKFMESVSFMARSLRTLRLLRLLTLAETAFPKVISFIDYRIDKDIAFIYDIGKVSDVFFEIRGSLQNDRLRIFDSHLKNYKTQFKGFVVGEEEISEAIQIIENNDVRNELKSRSVTDRLHVMKELAILQKNRPVIIKTIKTHQSINFVLHHMLKIAYQLKNDGILEKQEYQKIIDMIHSRNKFLRDHLTIVEQCPPNIIFR